MPQVDALRVEEFLVDGVVQPKVVFLDSLPKLRAVFLAQKHDSLPRARPQVVCLFHALNKQVMEVFAIIIKLD